MKDYEMDHAPSMHSDSVAAAIDPVCCHFEDAWRDGQPPRIEELLNEVDAPFREALFSELLGIEVEYRRSVPNSELDLSDEYRKRFPQYASLIGKLLLGDEESAAIHDTGAETTIDSPRRDKYSTTEHAALNRDTLKDYELRREIARGGMGVVYEAWQRSLKRTVAVKRILSASLVSDEQRQRFRTEAEAAARLDHPNIVPVYEVGESRGECFYAMGFVAGESLSDRLKGGPLQPREAAEIVAKVARAVQYAHDKGVIHRDLKPANILIGKNGEPRVTDFGLAKQLESDSELTQTGQVFGTPSYMPPEQARGMMDQVGVRADVYSLGAVLYALLTQRPPFASASIGETLKQVLEDEPIAPRQFSPRIGKDLQTICLKCLEKDPQRRYDSAKALADDLQRCLNGDSIQARRASPVVRLWRWSKRQPALAAGFAGAIVGLVVAGTAIGYMLPSYIRQAELANELANEQTRIQATNEKLVEIGNAFRNHPTLLPFKENGTVGPKTRYRAPSPDRSDSGYAETRIGDGLSNSMLFGELEPGITVETTVNEREGRIVSVRTVTPGTNADRLGLREGDRLVEINGTPVESETDIQQALATIRWVGQEGFSSPMMLLSATVIRDGKTVRLKAKARPVVETE